MTNKTSEKKRGRSLWKNYWEKLGKEFYNKKNKITGIIKQPINKFLFISFNCVNIPKFVDMNKTSNPIGFETSSTKLAIRNIIKIHNVL